MRMSRTGGAKGFTLIELMICVGIIILLAVFLVGGLIGGCGNVGARSLGGTQKIDLEPGIKVVNVTWKDANLWIVTRPMHTDEKPEVVTFEERSNLGIIQGKVIITEHRRVSLERER